MVSIIVEISLAIGDNYPHIFDEMMRDRSINKSYFLFYILYIVHITLSLTFVNSSEIKQHTRKYTLRVRYTTPQVQ